jgi:hypothetical protein
MQGVTEPQPFLVLDVQVGAAVEIGSVGAGARRVIPITGGRVSGAVTGEIIPGGADWQTLREDGALEIAAQYAFRTQDGAVVEVRSTGVRAGPPEVLRRLAAGEAVDPREYYFRTAMRFLTGAPELAHLNDRLAVARGERRAGGVRLEVFAVV